MIDIDLKWHTRQMTYRCQFGELSVFSIKFTGLKTAPNIFEIPAQEPSPAPAAEKCISYAYSLPCSDNQTPELKTTNGYIHHIHSVYKHYYVDTQGSFNEYCSRFKGKTLNSLKRKIKKVDKSNSDDSPSFRRFSKPEDIKEYIEIAKSISSKSYQEKLLGRELPTTEEFTNKLIESAKKNQFRGYILYAEDTPIAYNLCPIYGDGIKLYDFTGYDPAYGRYSAGTVLQFKIIEECFHDSDINIYDLCTGEGQHKEFFATGYKTCCDAYYFPATPYYLLVTHATYGIEKFARFTIALLAKAGLKEKIKKIIRHSK